VLALCTMLVIGHRMVEPTVIADWYAEFALRHLPQQFSAFAPAESSTGAFLFCIRRVVKGEMESTSVATFPSATPANTVALGDGRWRVDAHVLEDLPDGERVKRDFRCTTKYEKNRWVLEDLSVEQLAHAQAR
jgi:hypothetical protein